jgi:hypothetical protein
VAEYPASQEQLWDAFYEQVSTWYDESRAESRTSQKSPKQVSFELPRSPSPTTKLPEIVSPVPKRPFSFEGQPTEPQQGPGAFPTSETPEPEEVEITFSTPQFIGYTAPTRGDAIRLAKERDAILKEAHPDWDLLSQDEKERIREEAADSPISE